MPGKLTKSEAGYTHLPATQYTCDACPLWVTDSTCVWHRPEDRILARDTCSYYVLGRPNWFYAIIPGHRPLGFVTPETSGWTRNPSGAGYSCKRCVHMDVSGQDCESVDRTSPGPDPGIIHPNGCCNVWKADPVRSLK